MASGEGLVRRVADELEVRRIVARYADAVTHHDADAWVDTWAPDGRWVIGGGASEGHASLRDTWTRLMDCFERVVQLPQDGLIQLDGDAGSGRWSVVEVGRNADGGAFFSIGRYDDVYRRTGAGWKFAERHFSLIYAGPPDLTGAWTS